MSGEAVKVRCTQCSKLLQFVPRSAESQLKCPKCGHAMRVKTPAAGASGQPTSARRPAGSGPAGSRPAATRPAASRPSTPAQPMASTPAPDDFDWANLPSSPPVGRTSPPRYQTAPPAPRFAPPGPAAPGSFAGPPHAGRPQQSGGVNLVVKALLIAMGIFVGGGVLLVLAVVGVGMIASTQAQSKTTISLAGYSVQAPGRAVSDKRTAYSHEKGILHQTTNSEFSIATKKVAFGGQSFTIDQLFDSMKATNSVSDIRRVNRSGLDGYHFTMRHPLHNAVGTAEFFKLDSSQVLIVAYFPGTEKERINRGSARFDEAKTREIDDPEAFFASLSRD